MSRCHKLVQNRTAQNGVEWKADLCKSKRTLSVQKFSVVPNVAGREIQLCGIIDIGPTPENGCDSWSFSIKICSILKAVRLMRLSAAPPSIKTWYNLTLAMVGETSSESCPAPAILLGQSEA
jgi:hypothetical protein